MYIEDAKNRHDAQEKGEVYSAKLASETIRSKNIQNQKESQEKIGALPFPKNTLIPVMLMFHLKEYARLLQAEESDLMLEHRERHRKILDRIIAFFDF